jgi:hypothetical protein
MEAVNEENNTQNNEYKTYFILAMKRALLSFNEL